MRFVIIALATLCATAIADESAYDAAVDGKHCYEGSAQEFHCDFKVGKDLEFSIDGIGKESAAVSFVRANHKGDFWAAFGLLHGCVIVKHTPASTSRPRSRHAPPHRRQGCGDAACPVGSGNQAPAKDREVT